MKYARFRKADSANGPGTRVTLFVSGCKHNCPGCFNKEYQDFNYGKDWNDEIENFLISEIKKSHIRGLSVLGGEPMEQILDNDLVNFLARVRLECPDKTIWLWSGFTYEQIMKNPKRVEILEKVDVLIDGLWLEKLYNIKLKYAGSENQRVIDVKKSLEAGKVILLDVETRI